MLSLCLWSPPPGTPTPRSFTALSPSFPKICFQVPLIQCTLLFYWNKGFRSSDCLGLKSTSLGFNTLCTPLPYWLKSPRCLLHWFCNFELGQMLSPPIFSFLHPKLPLIFFHIFLFSSCVKSVPSFFWCMCLFLPVSKSVLRSARRVDLWIKINPNSRLLLFSSSRLLFSHFSEDVFCCISSKASLLFAVEDIFLKFMLDP